ncbi:hypothetical protein [Bacillus sp. SN10]|uniref:hypothetical protein n=1 Tax=Bacillus sp. SN10 TaxID=2056493 RepID=UPI001E3F93C2|nr:hypothetical protein [Bacillus sp. SN10]
MVDVHFYDWAKKRPKKHYNRLHEVYSRFLGKLKWENEHLIIVESKTSSWMEEVHVE